MSTPIIAENKEVTATALASPADMLDAGKPVFLSLCGPVLP